MPLRESQFRLSNSSRPSQKTYRETSSRQNTGSFSRGRRPTSQRHVRSSQEIPSTFPQESARRSQTRGRETSSEDYVSEYEDPSQRGSQIDLQLHGERRLTKDGRLNARQPTSSPLSSPPRELQSQQSSSRDTLPSAARNRETGADQSPDLFYDSPGRLSSESVRPSSARTHPEARQDPQSSRPSSIRDSFPEVVSGTGYTSGSGGGSLDSTDPNKTRALRNRNLGQFDVELRTLIEKAGWQVTKETLFTNPMPSVLELASMVRKSWDFARAGTDFPAELSTGVAGQVRYYHQRARSHMMEKAKGVIASYYGLAGMTGEQAKARVDYLLTDDRFNCDPDHYDVYLLLIQKARFSTNVCSPRNGTSPHLKYRVLSSTPTIRPIVGLPSTIRNSRVVSTRLLSAWFLLYYTMR
jgi:hypothetical protein